MSRVVECTAVRSADLQVNTLELSMRAAPPPPPPPPPQCQSVDQCHHLAWGYTGLVCYNEITNTTLENQSNSDGEFTVKQYRHILSGIRLTG